AALALRSDGLGGWNSSARELLGALHPRQLHREETIEQPRVEKGYRDEHEVGEVAFDQLQILQQRRQAEAHDPRVEAHTQPAECLRSNLLDDVRADRHADRDAWQ